MFLREAGRSGGSDVGRCLKSVRLQWHLEESDGENVSSFLENKSVNYIDHLGLESAKPESTQPAENLPSQVLEEWITLQFVFQYDVDIGAVDPSVATNAEILACAEEQNVEKKSILIQMENVGPQGIELKKLIAKYIKAIKDKGHKGPIIVALYGHGDEDSGMWYPMTQGTGGHKPIDRPSHEVAGGAICCEKRHIKVLKTMDMKIRFPVYSMMLMESNFMGAILP